jgi:hypothetical protein
MPSSFQRPQFLDVTGANPPQSSRSGVGRQQRQRATLESPGLPASAPPAAETRPAASKGSATSTSASTDRTSPAAPDCTLGTAYKSKQSCFIWRQEPAPRQIRDCTCCAVHGHLAGSAARDASPAFGERRVRALADAIVGRNADRLGAGLVDRRRSDSGAGGQGPGGSDRRLWRLPAHQCSSVRLPGADCSSTPTRVTLVRCPLHCTFATAGSARHQASGRCRSPSRMSSVRVAIPSLVKILCKW